MKIKEIYVKGFGCLADFRKEFHDGFNAVTENNGFGKTTLAAFVKAMFYSLNYTRASAVEENELKRFRPWNSAEKFGGSVTFEHEGKLYRIERSFGSTQKDETAFLIDFEKNKKTDVTRTELGKRLFGIDAAAFERCLYIPQKRTEIKSNDSFVEKLSNLLDNADDNNNFTSAMTRLRDFSRKLKLERGSGGLISEAEREKQQLEIRLSAQEEAQKKLEENQRQTLSALRETEAKKKQLGSLEARLNALEKQKQNAQAEGLRRIAVQRQTELEEKVVSIKRRQAELTPPSKKPSKKFTLSVCVSALLLAAVSVLGFCLSQPVLGGVFSALLLAGAFTLFLIRKNNLNRLEQDYSVQSGALEKELQDTLAMLEKTRGELKQCAATDSTYDESVYVRARAERERLAAEISDLQSRLVYLKTDAEWQTKALGDVADTRNMLDAAQARLVSLRKKYATAQTAMKLLSDAKESLTTAYAPKLRENFLRLICKATDGVYSDAIVSADFKTELNAGGATREMGYFSRGTRDLTDFCLRLALIQTMYGGNPPILILDDPFVNLDDDNFARATKLLVENANDCQIIYLTCTDRKARKII